MVSRSELADCEANYAWCLEKHLKNPLAEWRAVRLMELASKQLTIDDMRQDLMMPLLWYTKKEVRDIINDEDLLPAEPREPLSIPPQEEQDKVPLKKVATKDGCNTMTLGALIEQLTALQARLGHNAPVFHAEFGSITPTTGIAIEPTAAGTGVCIY